jgi:hypothetical protein
MPDQSAKMPDQSAKQTQFDIGIAASSQAAPLSCKDDPRYKRDKEEEKRVISGEADAIATPPSSLFFITYKYFAPIPFYAVITHF